MKNLKKLLDPKSIAVIGASRDRKKLGRLLLDNIIVSGYKGKLYPVNPKAKKIGKLKCYESIGTINKPVDLAIISIPAKFVLEVVQECCKGGVGAVAVISAGFSELGAEGLKMEVEMKTLSEKYKVPILGPNCLGTISTQNSMNATFAKNKVSKGNIAFLSQSGAVGTACLDWAEKTGIGLSYFISIGNKAALSEEDFILYLAKDPSVKVIALYLEDFADGRTFMDVIRKAKKPVVILKPGKSEAAQEALGLHTGSLAQDDRISSSALTQCGAIRVETIEELFNVLEVISWSDRLVGRNVAIITNAGGPGVITTDAVELMGLKLAKLENKTRKLLELKLPPASNVNNPVDVLGDALTDRYETALTEVIKDAGVDAIIVLLTPQVMTEIRKTAKQIIKFTKKTKKIILAVFIGGKETEKGRRLLLGMQIPTFSFPIDAVRSLSYLWEYERRQHKLKSGGDKIPSIQIKNKKQLQEKMKNEFDRISEMMELGTTLVDVQIVQRILKSYDIPILRSYFPQDVAGARKAAEKLDYPLVLKLSHERILHRTEKQAVKLDIDNVTELVRAYNELVDLAEKEKLKNYKIELQEFVKDALEVIIGIKYDADQYAIIEGKNILRKKGFGHSVVFGMGGIYTEVYEDIGLRVAPLSKVDIEEMISETKVSKVLKGFRGKTYNKDKIREVILKMSQLVLDFPQIKELDINPLFVKEDKVWVVDSKMFVSL